MKNKSTNWDIFSCWQHLLKHRSLIKTEYFLPQGATGELLTSLSYHCLGLGILLLGENYKLRKGNVSSEWG